MRRIGSLLLALAMVAGVALVGPASVSAGHVGQWVLGPGAHARWTVTEDGVSTETGLSIYNQVVSPGTAAAPLAVVYQYVYTGVVPDETPVALLYGATDTFVMTVEWPTLVSANGDVWLSSYSGWDFGPGGERGESVHFSETWTGQGPYIHGNSPASAWGTPGVDHHVFKDGPNLFRDAALSSADPLGGSLGASLGSLDFAELFYVRIRENDVCRGTQPDPNTGECP